MTECIDNAFLLQNKFRFVIHRAPNFTATVQDISVPSINLGEAPQSTPWLDVPEPGEKLIYEGINASFLIQSNLKNWLEIHQWLLDIAGVQYEGREDYGDLKVDATIQLLDAQDNVTATIMIYDLFPIDLGDIPLTTTASEPATCAVAFRYSHYEIKVDC